MDAGRVTAAQPVPAYAARRGNLLLLAVEPLASEALLLRNAFDKQFSLVLTDSAADGLLAAGEFHPDVVLAAARLCDISSEQLVSTLQRRRPVSVIIGAGPDDGPVAEAAMRAGTDDH